MISGLTRAQAQQAFRNGHKIILKTLSTELLRKMLAEIKDEL